MNGELICFELHAFNLFLSLLIHIVTLVCYCHVELEYLLGLGSKGVRVVVLHKGLGLGLLGSMTYDYSLSFSFSVFPPSLYFTRALFTLSHVYLSHSLSLRM